ncbi:MAG: S1 family peptidase [Myxococcota bacterium]
MPHRTAALVLVALLATVLAVSGCEPPPPGAEAADDGLETAALPIAGGYEDDADRAVVGLVSFGGQGMGMCTGSLIAPNVVLTAQHCVAPLESSGDGGGVNCGVTTFGPHYVPEAMHVTTRSRITQDPDAWTATQEIIVPQGSDEVCGNDVALLILEQPIPSVLASPLTPRVDSPLVAETPFQLASGEGYSAIGYGATNDAGTGSGVRRRRDDLNVTCEGADCQMYGATTTEWVGHTGVCRGDSGGPAVDEDGRVVGVASRGAPGCQYPVYGYVYAWGDWITEHVLTASEEAGLEPPRWATGWPTDPAYSAPIGGTCFDGTTCPSGRCVDGVCSRNCSEAAPCPDGFVCGAEDGLCAPLPVGDDCAGDADCGGGQCSDEGYCTRACTALLDCPVGYGCADEGGVCERLPVGGGCTVDADCAPGACFDGYCTRGCGDHAPCPDAYGCEPQSQLCLLDPMGAACEVAGDCESGLCADGRCTRACDEETPCDNGWTCDAGRCALIPVFEGCAEHAECGGGACIEGDCTRMCHDGAPCPEGWVCSPGSGLCEQTPASGSSDPSDATAPGEDAGAGTNEAVSSGCSGGASGTPLAWLAALVALLPLAGRRKRSLPSP